MEAQVFDVSDIDLALHVAALRRAFQTSTWADEIGASMTEEFYRWKYNTPAGTAKIACVVSSGAPVSGVSAFPLFFGGRGLEPEIGWQIGDIMTIPEMRGRGLYTRCLAALVEALDDQLLICFPNERSRRPIERSGFLRVADVDTYVHPLLGFCEAKGIQLLNLDRLDWPLEGLNGQSRLGVFKDHSYFSWRYLHRPNGIYQAVGGPEGVAVVRSFEVFGKSVAVIMEFHPTSLEGVRPLLAAVHRWAAMNQMRAAFLMTNWFPARPLKFSYWWIPPQLLPKRQSLYVRYPRGKALDCSWSVQIGDWDGL